MERKKIVIAVGGTGGHLFPAQRFAEDLSLQMDAEVLFAGKGLSSNPYFNREQFLFCDVDSLTPFRKSGLHKIKAAFSLFQGIWQSVKILLREKPHLVVGFGSFHAFPLLAAALLTRTPMALFESNAVPGKVIRLFSARSVFTAIYLEGAKAHLKGNVVPVVIPTQSSLHKQTLSKKEARVSLGLDPDLKTLLVFGGSQGSQKINESVFQMISLLKQKDLTFQLIHLTGSDEMAKRSQEFCTLLQIPCYTAVFEKEMASVWTASDGVICRAGAMTVAEILHYEVVPILIPYPFASDGHQEKNAQFLVKEMAGAVCISEESMSALYLADQVFRLFRLDAGEVARMQSEIQGFKKREERKPHLAALVKDFLER